MIGIAILLTGVGVAPGGPVVPVDSAAVAAPVTAATPVTSTAPAVRAVTRQAADAWLSEDKFRHAAASWTATVFTYAAVRAVDDDGSTALAVALPVSAAFGIAKEIVDRRGGGPFSFRDLAADALGAGAAWLFLREMR